MIAPEPLTEMLDVATLAKVVPTRIEADVGVAKERTGMGANE